MSWGISGFCGMSWTHQRAQASSTVVTIFRTMRLSSVAPL